MRRLLLVLALVMTPSMSRAQAPGDPDRAAIRSVIERQLGAFRRDDGAAAFAFASPGIKAMFGTPGNFIDMVRRAYQPVYRPREVEFRDLGDEGGRLTQRVLLVGPDGLPVIARYVMQRQPDGWWLIDGCVIEASPELST